MYEFWTLQSQIIRWELEQIFVSKSDNSKNLSFWLSHVNMSPGWDRLYGITNYKLFG